MAAPKARTPVLFVLRSLLVVLLIASVQSRQVGANEALHGPYSATVSPDGAHVYVVSSFDSALAVFSRDGATGALTFVEGHFDGVAGVDGLNGGWGNGATAVTVSPDGAHVYVASEYESALVVFSRDAGTGALTFIEVYFNDVDGVAGLGGAHSVTVSPDGAHVYVASTWNRAVAVFSRDGGTGALTFVEAHVNGVGGVAGLVWPESVTVSPDGAHVYVASSIDDAVTLFSRDAGTGELTFVEAQFDGVGGVAGLDGPESVTVSPDGAHVYVASFFGDSVAVFSRDMGTGALTFVEAQFDGAGGVDGLNGAMALTVSPDGAHVYVASMDDHAVAVFDRDAGTGALAFVEAQFDSLGGVDGLVTARSVTVSPAGAHVYVVGWLDDAVAVFARDGATGELTFVEAQFDDAIGVDRLEETRSVAVSPDGVDLYVASFPDDAVAVFNRAGGTGALTAVEAPQVDGVAGVDGLRGARSVGISPGDEHVYVAGLSASAIAVFGRDEQTGILTFVGSQRDGMPASPYSVTVSPDGAHVYVVASSFFFFPHAVSVFSRDTGTGTLAFVEEHYDRMDGTIGLAGARSVAVSPDGSHVYVASAFDDDAVVAFSRHAGAGTLTFVEAHFDGVGGVDGLNGAMALTVSPDGAHVYVASADDDAVALFSRDAGSGALTFVEAEFDGVGGIDGLDGARSIALSPDGAHVYVASFHDNAVAVFSRDGVTGELALVEVHFDGIAGIDGLDEAVSVAVSPDGAHVYVASLPRDEVAIFQRDGATGALTFVGVVEGRFGGIRLLFGKRLLIKNSVPEDKERNKGTWLAKDAGITAPVRGGSDDPRCNGDPAGTVKATIRFFSDGSAGSTADSGEIPLPCENWNPVGRDDNPRGYKYRDKPLDDGPCSSLLLKDGRKLRAICLGKGATTDFLYDLNEGTDEGTVNVVLVTGTFKHCTAFDDFNGRDGSDGKQFLGKNLPPPLVCPAVGSPSGAFLDERPKPRA
jgi:6-phosphogluconolactonase (cycloisomerase 2 family)